ncbi:hypothetical protein AVEN_64184-1 [Araneus ventricosus]|uniref:Uncharacterized protein n=1 Tax=Araneus ventricosus TaxID=182803 RepID=A0A4Y2SLV7_ARAVE|nr:hypothetical protein AVEN_64184-1 [Araneus ventricosus]
MDAKLYHCLKYKVNQVLPAIFADNMTKVVMEGYKVPWKMNFTTKDCFERFRTFYGSDILFDIEVVICPFYESTEQDPGLWHRNEYNFSKLLYGFKNEFGTDMAEKDEESLIFHCSILLYFSAMYFKEGLTNAPTMAFLEVYSLACLYLQQKSFTPELGSALCY